VLRFRTYTHSSTISQAKVIMAPKVPPPAYIFQCLEKQQGVSACPDDH
jgi:hypothetical protein